MGGLCEQHAALMIWPLARRLLSKAAAVLILLGVGVGAGLLLSPGVSAQRLPYGDTSLGRVATQTVRARRDYDILDEEATRKRREESPGRRSTWSTTMTAVASPRCTVESPRASPACARK